MSESIYHATVSPRFQAAVRKAADWSEFTYRDDPQFKSFCKAVQCEVEVQKIERTGRNSLEPDTVRKNKLYGVWYTTSTFRNHWHHPTKRSENDMLWILYNRGWSYGQGRVAIVAWWRLHHRKFTTTTLEELDRLADRVWNEVQTKNMKKKLAAKQNSLRNRILAFLRQQPATTAYLAEKLSATSKAVDSHLYRLRKEGIVERLSWGLYASRRGTGTVAAKVDRQIERTTEPQPMAVPKSFSPQLTDAEWIKQYASSFKPRPTLNYKPEQRKSGNATL